MPADTLDLRDLPPDERHELVFETFENLDPGESLTVINDHDPRPLIHQMEATLDAFDGSASRVEQEGEERFVAALPKRDPDDGAGDQAVRNALQDVPDPDLGGISVVDSGVVSDVHTRSGAGSGTADATVVLNAAGLSEAQVEELAADVETAVEERTDLQGVRVTTGGHAEAGRLTESEARTRLRDVRHPDRAGDVVETGVVTDVAVDGQRVTVRVATDALNLDHPEREREVFDRLGTPLYNAGSVETVRIDTGDTVVPVEDSGREDPAMAEAPGAGMGGPPGAEGTTPLQQPDQVGGQRTEAPPTIDLSGIDDVVVVASAKGGVGKTTVATQLARALATDGGDVGLLDADFSGPDVPRLLDLDATIAEGQAVDPVTSHGLQVMSVGLMENRPTAWNGDMVHNALFNLLEDVDWDVSTLVVDLPPGVSDTMMTMLQFVPIDGVVLVTTPYPTSVADTNEGATLFREGDVSVIGAVVNMAGFECPSCGDRHDLFAGGVGTELDFPVLRELPFSESIRSFDGEPPEEVVSVAETVAESVSTLEQTTVPDDAVDVCGLPERGRLAEVEDAFAATAPGEQLSVVSDRHPARLAVALVDHVDTEGGPSEAFDDYSVESLAADEWLLTVTKPAAVEAGD